MNTSLLIIAIVAVGEGNGSPLQYSCLENSMDRGAWWAPVHEVAKSWTRLSDWALLLWCNFSIMNTNANLRQTKMDLNMVLQVPETIVNFILKDYHQHECKRKILEPSWTPSTSLLCLRSTGLKAFIVCDTTWCSHKERTFTSSHSMCCWQLWDQTPRLVFLLRQSAAPCQPWGVVSACSYRLLGGLVWKDRCIYVRLLWESICCFENFNFLVEV